MTDTEVIGGLYFCAHAAGELPDDFADVLLVRDCHLRYDTVPMKLIPRKGSGPWIQEKYGDRIHP